MELMTENCGGVGLYSEQPEPFFRRGSNLALCGCAFGDVQNVYRMRAAVFEDRLRQRHLRELQRPGHALRLHFLQQRFQPTGVAPRHVVDEVPRDQLEKRVAEHGEVAGSVRGRREVLHDDLAALRHLCDGVEDVDAAHRVELVQAHRDDGVREVLVAALLQPVGKLQHVLHLRLGVGDAAVPQHRLQLADGGGAQVYGQDSAAEALEADLHRHHLAQLAVPRPNVQHLRVRDARQLLADQRTRVVAALAVVVEEVHRGADAQAQRPDQLYAADDSIEPPAAATPVAVPKGFPAVACVNLLRPFRRHR
eukprot:Rhum_TRINITY_DN21035_c0_g1::Rhum_TRINITY_DN21035_c0_g1_i1::g.173008::m.173008